MHLPPIQKRQKTTQKWSPQGAPSKMELAIWDHGTHFLNNNMGKYIISLHIASSTNLTWKGIYF